MLNVPYRASKGVEVMTNLRFSEPMTYQNLTKIFKKKISYDQKLHKGYLLAFFECVYPRLLKNYMAEQNISKQEILDVFNLLPQDLGEIMVFKERMKNGEF